jgi:hypothetical protein
MLYCVVQSHLAVEAMELTVGRGNIVAVIKKHNPLGDTRMWFVDDGSKLHFCITFSVYTVKPTGLRIQIIWSLKSAVYFYPAYTDFPLTKCHFNGI